MTTFGDKILKISYVTKGERGLGGGAFYLTKNAEIFETGSNGKEISWKKLQKIQKYLHFRHRTIQPKIPGRKSNGTKISRKRFSKTLVYLRGVFLFFRNYVNLLFSFNASSFGRDHSELDISRKEDGSKFCFRILPLV